MFNDKQIKTVIAFSVVIFIVLISVFFINTFHNNSLKFNETKEEPVLSLTNDSNIFKVKSIQIYSSANALNNLETQKDYWDLDLFQYSDIAISIDNHVSIDDLTQKNTIKELYIDNIQYPKSPDKGKPHLYLKKANLLGIGVIDPENLINNRVDFNIISENTDDERINDFYADCSNPIIISAINEDIVKNFIIRNTRSAVTFDGNLLVDSTILLSNIEYTISFSIHIINNLDEEYICNIEIPIKLSDDNDINTIYDGSYQVVLTDIPSGKFYKREN
jgi:hypothetical protein